MTYSSSTKRIVSLVLGIVMLVACTGISVSAANYGEASIGFSAGGIHYVPMGISGVESSLGLSFGEHAIDNNSPVQTYPSLNKAGYVVSNSTGGNSGYTVTLTLSAFDNGLEGAVLSLKADELGLISEYPGAVNPPILLGNQGAVELEADGGSSAVILEGTKKSENPGHTALGRWGANFVGDLTVYTSTIATGDARAVMTWEINIA